MRIFSNFFKGRDAPVNRTSGSAYSFFMGGSTSGKRVNERTAMQMTAVYSCVRSIFAFLVVNLEASWGKNWLYTAFLQHCCCSALLRER